MALSSVIDASDPRLCESDHERNGLHSTRVAGLLKKLQLDLIRRDAYG